MRKTDRSKAEYIILHKLPRCKKCEQLIIATCDRNKPPRLEKYEGQMFNKMWVYPTTTEQSKICDSCKLGLHKIGRES